MKIVKSEEIRIANVPDNVTIFVFDDIEALNAFCKKSDYPTFTLERSDIGGGVTMETNEGDSVTFIYTGDNLLCVKVKVK